MAVWQNTRNLLYQPFQSRLWGSCFDCILTFLWPAQHILRGFLSFHYKNGINLIISSYFAYFLFMIEVKHMSKPTRASIIIREGRKRAGLTQQELADKLGITTGAVSNYENGVSFPKAEIAFGLCDILDITPRELFESE